MSPDDLERLAVRCLHAVKDAELHAFDEMPMYDVAVLDTARLAALREVLREALEVDEYPTLTCPQCGDTQTDMDGFGFLACDVCGYCTHPSLTGGICEICQTVIEPATTP